MNGGSPFGIGRGQRTKNCVSNLHFSTAFLAIHFSTFLSVGFYIYVERIFITVVVGLDNYE